MGSLLQTTLVTNLCLKKAVKFAMDSVVTNHKMEYKRANN